MSGLEHSGAFVVQFETGADFDAGLVKGRIEHVASSQTSRFESANELLASLARILKDVEAVRRSR